MSTEPTAEQWLKALSMLRDDVGVNVVAHLLSRAERAEREAKEAKATLFPRWRPASEHGSDFEDGEAMLVAVRAGALGRPSWWDVAFVTIRCDEGQFQVRCEGEPWGWEWCDVVYYIPARELTASIPALTRNSAGGGLEHERGAGGGNQP